MLGKFVDNYDTWQVGRQRLAFAATLGRSDNLFFGAFVDRFDDAFRFVEKGKLWRCRIGCLLGLTSEQALAQQCVFFFKMNDAALVGLALNQHLL